MARNDFYADGQWNFICDLCGRKNKSSNAVQTWDNFWVCKYHKEIRNPQDFVRGVTDIPAPPWLRPEPPDAFVQVGPRLLQETGGKLLITPPDSDTLLTNYLLVSSI